MCLDLNKVTTKKNLGIDNVSSCGYINQISLRVYWLPTLDTKLKVPTFLTTVINQLVFQTNAQSLHKS